MIIYVNSFEEAKAYPVMFNTSEIFLDANQDKFYCKAVDKMGKVAMSTYEFHQIENEKPLTSANFVPREQFDALSSKLDNLMMLLTTQQTPVATSPALASTPAPTTQAPQAVATTSSKHTKGGNSDAK